MYRPSQRGRPVFAREGLELSYQLTRLFDREKSARRHRVNEYFQLLVVEEPAPHEIGVRMTALCRSDIEPRVAQGGDIVVYGLSFCLDTHFLKYLDKVAAGYRVRLIGLCAEKLFHSQQLLLLSRYACQFRPLPLIFFRTCPCGGRLPSGAFRRG